MASLLRLGYSLSAIILDRGEESEPVHFAPDIGGSGAPLVSCIMPTRGHAFPAQFAIQCFRRQTYANCELVVVCASHGSEVERYLGSLADPRIRLIVEEGAATVGEMRNAAIADSRGELICIWDDDDLSHPQRIENQLAGLQKLGGRAVFLARLLLWSPEMRRLAVSGLRLWENSMLVKKAELPPYPHMKRGSDTVVVKELRDTGRVIAVDHPASYCYVAHGRNLWGADHFEAFFTSATMQVAPEAYDSAIDSFSGALPMLDYQRQLAIRGAGKTMSA